jgi:Icc-related predicted phosphoesterase
MKLLDNLLTDNQRVLFAGDIHGNINHAAWVFKTAADNNCSHIIACGDFGYWVHLRRGQQFVDEIARMADKFGIQFLWVDGNHENHDILNNLLGKHGDTEPIPTPNEWVKWIPRGCQFQIGGSTFMGYGGAYSVDKADRIAGQSWWEGETLDQNHIDSVPLTKVDFLVTHEAPLGANLSYKDEIRESVEQRALISRLVDRVQPTRVICGHHHTRQRFFTSAMSNIDDDGIDGILVREVEVNVLGRDTMRFESIAIFDV